MQSFWRRFSLRLRSVARMSRSDRTLVAESVVMLAAARILVKATPRGQLIRRIGGAVPETVETGLSEVVMGTRALDAVHVGKMVERVSHFTWWRSMCLEKALAGRWMLRRRGIASVMYVGMAKQGQEFVAHAWLVGEGRTVTGGGLQKYSTLAAFRELKF